MKFFKNLYNYRELLKSNVKKEVRGKYKKSFFGILWSFLNPLLQIAVYALVFPIILKNAQENYVIFLCVALIPWTFFAGTIVQSASTIITNGNIIKKVYFPREILPISITTSNAINFLISTVIILLFVLFSGIGFSWYIVFFPIVFIVQYFLLLGISFIVASITVYFRDLEHLIGIFLQLLFYATPIVYSSSMVPKNFQFIMKLNPMSHVIDGYRAIFYYKQIPNMQNLLILLGLSIILSILGYLIFNKLQKGFAEEL